MILANKQKGHVLPQVSFQMDGWSDRYRGYCYNTITTSFWDEDKIHKTGFTLGLIEWEASFAAAMAEMGIENDEGVIVNPLDDSEADEYEWQVCNDDIIIAIPKSGANQALVFVNVVKNKFKLSLVEMFIVALDLILHLVFLFSFVC